MSIDVAPLWLLWPSLNNCWQVGGEKTEDETISAQNQIHSVSVELSSIIVISVRKLLFDGQILAKMGIW